MKLNRLFLILILIFLINPITKAQNGTQHGIFVTFTGVSGITVYDVFRCPGTCTTSSTGWVQIAMLNTGTSYLDPAAGLSLSTTYSYAAASVNGSEESVYSNIATVTTPSAFPTNPNAPTGCSATVQ